METNSKWGKKFWVDLGERVGSVGLYGTATVITMDNVLEGPDFQSVLWPILVLPMALCAIKGLSVNLKGPEPSPSLVGVTSTTSDIP